jgi:hypothetical protein
VEIIAHEKKFGFWFGFDLSRGKSDERCLLWREHGMKCGSKIIARRVIDEIGFEISRLRVICRSGDAKWRELKTIRSVESDLG